MNSITSRMLQDISHGLPPKGIQLSATRLQPTPSARRFWSFLEFSRKEKFDQDEEAIDSRKSRIPLLTRSKDFERRFSDSEGTAIDTASSTTLDLNSSNPSFQSKPKNLKTGPQLPKLICQDNLMAWLDGNPVPKNMKWKLKGYKTLRHEDAGDFGFVPGGTVTNDIDILPRNKRNIPRSNLRLESLPPVKTKHTIPNQSKALSRSDTLSKLHSKSENKFSKDSLGRNSEIQTQSSIPSNQLLTWVKSDPTTSPAKAQSQHPSRLPVRVSKPSPPAFHEYVAQNSLLSVSNAVYETRKIPPHKAPSKSNDNNLTRLSTKSSILRVQNLFCESIDPVPNVGLLRGTYQYSQKRASPRNSSFSRSELYSEPESKGGLFSCGQCLTQNSGNYGLRKSTPFAKNYSIMKTDLKTKTSAPAVSTKKKNYSSGCNDDEGRVICTKGTVCPKNPCKKEDSSKKKDPCKRYCCPELDRVDCHISAGNCPRGNNEPCGSVCSSQQSQKKSDCKGNPLVNERDATCLPRDPKVRKNCAGFKTTDSKSESKGKKECNKSKERKDCKREPQGCRTSRCTGSSDRSCEKGRRDYSQNAGPRTYSQIISSMDEASTVFTYHSIAARTSQNLTLNQRHYATSNSGDCSGKKQSNKSPNACESAKKKKKKEKPPANCQPPKSSSSCKKPQKSSPCNKSDDFCSKKKPESNKGSKQESMKERAARELKEIQECKGQKKKTPTTKKASATSTGAKRVISPCKQKQLKKNPQGKGSTVCFNNIASHFAAVSESVFTFFRDQSKSSLFLDRAYSTASNAHWELENSPADTKHWIDYRNISEAHKNDLLPELIPIEVEEEF